MSTWRSILGFCLAAVFLCALPLSAQQIPGKFQLVVKGGEDISITLQGRNLILRPGDTIPTGATIRTTAGTNVVISPVPGVLIVVEQNTQMKLVRNSLLLSGVNPSSQIGLELFTGRLSVDTANSLSPGSRIVINTPQGQFLSNNAAFTVSTRIPDLARLDTIAGGVGVVSGRVTAVLSNGEQLGVREGSYLAISGVGSGLVRYTRPGTLPDSLAIFKSGEQPTEEGDSQVIGGGRVGETAENNLQTATTEIVYDALFALLGGDDGQLGEGETISLNGGTVPNGVFPDGIWELTLEDSGDFQLGAGEARGMDGGDVPLGLFPPSMWDIPEGLSLGPTSTNPISQSGTTGEKIAALIESVSIGNSEPPPTVLTIPTITSSSSVSGIRNTSFSYQVITDITATISASGLPPGLSLSGSTINGIPTTNGTFNVTLTASSSDGTSEPFYLVITINSIESPILTISPTVPANLVQATTYTFTLTATSPNGAALGSILQTAGTLPTGLAFTGGNTISGTVTASSGSFSTTFSVSNADGSATTTLLFSVNVLPLTPNTNVIPGAASQAYVAPNGTNSSAALNAISNPVPGGGAFLYDPDSIPGNGDEYYIPDYWGAGGEAAVIAGGGGLYWPWTDTTLGLSLLQAGIRPDGDLFAAFYVYTNYSFGTAGNSSTIVLGTGGAGGFVDSIGTYPIPPQVWGTGWGINP